MELCAGLDVHGTSSTVVVVNQHGKQVGQHVLATNGAELVTFFKGQRGRVHLCIEEGTQSGWLWEVLSPHVAELVVAGVCEGRRGAKDDARDAKYWAEQLRLGAVAQRVYKPLGSYGTLRQLVKAHQVVVCDTVRMQNRIGDVAGDVEKTRGLSARQEQAQKLARSCKIGETCDRIDEYIVSAARTTTVRWRASIERLDEATDGDVGLKSPRIGYAPPEYRTKPWSTETQIAGWFPFTLENTRGLVVDGNDTMRFTTTTYVSRFQEHRFSFTTDLPLASTVLHLKRSARGQKVFSGRSGEFCLDPSSHSRPFKGGIGRLAEYGDGGEAADGVRNGESQGGEGDSGGIFGWEGHTGSVGAPAKLRPQGREQEGPAGVRTGRLGGPVGPF